MLNNLKNLVGKGIRKIIVMYYRMLGVSVGDNVFISHLAKIDTTYRNSIIIGNDCLITGGAAIIAHDHSVYRHTSYNKDDGKGTVILEDNVFIGAGAIVLRNVRIGKNSIVAAGAVVNMDVPENVIVAGNPAVVIKEFIMTKKLERP